MERERAIEETKRYLKDYITSHLDPSRGRNGGEKMYICPLCGSGTGKNKTGAFSIEPNGKRWICFACGKSGDIYDLIGVCEGITDYNEQLKRAFSLYGISIDRYQPSDISKVISVPTEKPAQTEPETDYSQSLAEYAKHLGETTYYRGISKETLQRFHIGYCAKWTHPKAPNSTPSPRLIIPTSKYSYIARATDGNPDRVKKAGRVHIFNEKALNDAKSPIFIVEGEIDALSILDLGFPAIGLGGISNKAVFMERVQANKPSQPLLIALDNDPAGERTGKELKEMLDKVGITAYRLGTLYGEGKDANDALNNEREAFKERLAKLKTEPAVREAVQQEARQDYRKNSVGSYLPHFAKMIENRENNKYTPTGFAELDTILDGGIYSGLYIIGAISSLGKTTLTMQIADNIAKSGKDVLIITLEQSKAELIAKSISRITAQESLKRNEAPLGASTTNEVFRAGQRYGLFNDEKKKLMMTALFQYYPEYAKNIYMYEGVGDIKAVDIEAKVKEHITATGKKPFVVIDYLQILAPDDVRASDKQNTDKAVLVLKRLCRDYDISILAISSFNRENYNTSVNLASFKESGSIEYCADCVIGLQYKGLDDLPTKQEDRKKALQELIENNNHKARTCEPIEIEAKIMKHRNGARGKTTLGYYPAYNLFIEKKEWKDL